MPLCGFLPKPDGEPDHPGNPLSWEDWFEACRRVNLDPYHMHMGEKELTALIADRLDSPVLEVGCGLGGLINQLDKNCEAVGVDISSFCIEKSEDNVDPNDNVSLVHSDFFNLSPSIGSFSSFVAVDVFHMMDRKKALSRARKFLTPEGTIYITDSLADRSLSHLFTPFEAQAPVGEREYRQILDKSGFREPSIEDQTDRCIRGTKRILKHFKTADVKKWIEDKWGKEYYRKTINLSKRWLKQLNEGSIKYALISAKK